VTSLFPGGLTAARSSIETVLVEMDELAEIIRNRYDYVIDMLRPTGSEMETFIYHYNGSIIQKRKEINVK